MSNVKKVPVKKVKKSKKTKFRMLLAFILFGFIISTLSYNLFKYLQEINNIKKEKETLEGRLANLKDEEEVLKTDIQKLEDPEYVAKYAREKYLYSKDGEYIIRIPEEK